MTIRMVSKDGYKAADIDRIKAGIGCEIPYYEVLTYTKDSSDSQDFRTAAYGSLKEAVEAVREFTGRGTYEQTNKSDNAPEVERFRQADLHAEEEYENYL